MRKSVIIILLMICVLLTAAVVRSESERIDIKPEVLINEDYLAEIGQKIPAPSMINTDSVGNLYILDGYGTRVFKFTAAGKFIWVKGLKKQVPAASRVSHMRQFLIDSRDNLYFVAGSARAIYVTDTDLVWKRTINLPMAPQSAALDSKGNIHTVGYKKGEVDKIIYTYSPEGIFIRKYGKNATLVENRYNRQLDESFLVIDSNDNVYHFFEYYRIVRIYSGDGKLIKDTLWPEAVSSEERRKHYAEAMKKHVTGGDTIPREELITGNGGDQPISDGALIYLLVPDKPGQLLVLNGKLETVKAYYFRGEPFNPGKFGIGVVNGKIYVWSHEVKGGRGVNSVFYQFDK